MNARELEAPVGCLDIRLGEDRVMFIFEKERQVLGLAWKAQQIQKERMNETTQQDRLAAISDASDHVVALVLRTLAQNTPVEDAVDRLIMSWQRATRPTD